MALTKEQQNIIRERNEKIFERYCVLSEEQPLATHYKILSYLANEYNLTPQRIGAIVKELIEYHNINLQ